jgi:predicted nucleic acid-binding protein
VVYLDTVILIYLLEGHPSFGQSIATELTRLESQGQTFTTSVLTITEYLAGTSETTTEALKQIQRLSFVAVDEAIATRSADLQREHGLKIGDAIHLATCLERGCELFFTNDQKLAKAAKDYCVVLRPAAA